MCFNDICIFDFFFLVAEMIKPKGINPLIVYSIEDRMKKAGIVNTNVKCVEIPVHHGGKLGELFWYVIINFYMINGIIIITE